MVCIMEDDKEALCVVRDFSGISHDWKVELLVSASTTGKQFLRDIADRYNFEPDSFRLVSPTPSKKDNIYQAVITKDSEETLKDIGINFGNGSRNLFIVEGLDGGNPRLIMKNDDLELGASASPEEPSSSNSSSPPLLTESSYRRSYRESKGLSGYRYPGSRSSLPIESFSSSEYRGLVNQAMTCYLNSLLQALFMTPEFRNALYNWRFIPSSGMDESKSIPYQLQKLFLNLQTSPRDAVETTELTRSFGWDSSEAWQQHDVQELCRVMFDALEHEFKGTEQADLINGLYQGKMIDYVKCLECGTEKSREDTFLDIPLPVRPFGSSTAYGSVEEALRAFVQPELLEGNNQYFCEKCNKKCNAHKGLKFSRFPYLLTLHLMRFDFDYNTMHRIKLSDKVSFPQTLNLNNFIPCANITPTTLYKEEGSEGFPEEITGSSSKCDDSSTTDSGSALDDESCMASSNDNVDYEQEVDEGIDVSNQIENEKNRNHNGAESGPYVYELFSIMVHSGSAAGGHYYAYIKDFETGCWYCFNDQQVYRINSEQIETSFGGCGTSRGFCSSAYSSSMNAYMLMYRQIDKERNVLPLKEDKFPPHIKALLKEMNEKAKVYWKSKEKEREMCKIKVYVDHPVSNKRIDCKIDCETREPLKEVVQKAYKKLQLESAVPFELCRLVLYNSNLDSVDNSLEGKENEEIGIILSSYGVVRKNEMLMEIRSKDTPFRIYKPNSVPLKILLVKLEQNRIENPIIFRTSVWSTVEEFRNELYQHFGQDPSKMNMFIMVEITGNIVKFIEKDDSRLKDCSSELPNAKIFVSFEPFEYDILKVRKAMRMVVQQYFNIVRLNIILPDIKPEILKKWSIPTLSEYNSSTSQKISEEILAHEKVIPHSDTPNEECEITINGIAGLHNNSINNNINSVSVLSPSLNTSTSSTDETCPSEIPLPNSNIAPVNIGGHHSDQSASEDSSLTDSDRTIVGDPQEDYLMSSSGSSPRAGDIRDRLNNDWDGNYFDTWNRFNDDSDNDYYFKELCNSVTIDKKKNGMISDIKIEVDKRMSIDLFKKNLEQYVQAPSSCFKIVLGDSEFPFQMINTSLKLIENDTTLYVKLSPPLKPNTLKVKLFVFDYNASKIDNFIDEFPIDEEKTVGETKADLIPFLKSVHNLNIDFERCRLRVLSAGMRRVCLNHEVWSNLKLENDCHLYIQELNSSESIVEPDKQIDLLIRRFHPVTRNCDPIQEIVLEDFTAKGLRAKISEVSDIPEENLTLILQEITQRPSYFRVESDMDSWNAITDFNFEEKWSIISKEVNYLINYKDSKEESNDDAFDRKRVKKMIRHEKPLRIQHNKRNVAENVSSS